MTRSQIKGLEARAQLNFPGMTIGEGGIRATEIIESWTAARGSGRTENGEAHFSNL